MSRAAILVSFLIATTMVAKTQNNIVENRSDGQILKLIENHRPSLGGEIPPDMKYRLGATHMDGQYYFTTEPYIIEGAEKLNELGYGIIKLWFAKANGNAKGYRFNSDWKLTREMTFKELAQHPYYRKVFDMPFKVFALNINEGFGGASTEDQTLTLNRIEIEFYELTKFLLEQYKDRELTFIFKMWEGDWLMRGGTQPGAHWKENGVPSDAPVRVKNMIDWINARQRGVERARIEIKESKCKVYNAVEVNKVYDGIEGIPSVTTSVLPEIKVDMVSWSAYDGKSKDGLKMYKGIDIIKQHMVPSDYMKGEKIVFIGEIGEAENMNSRTRESVREFWDIMLGVYLAQDIPFIFHWELFCNENKDNSPRLQNRNKTADELKGFWLIRPDGSKGWAEEYFQEIMAKDGY
jgi:hypothetical protein